MFDLVNASQEEFDGYQKQGCEMVARTAQADDKMLLLIAKPDGSWTLIDLETDGTRYGEV